MGTDSKVHYFRNELLVSDDGTIYRLLRISDEPTQADPGNGTERHGTAWLIQLGSTHALPCKMSMGSLRQTLTRFTSADQATASADSDGLSKSMKALPRRASKASIELSERAFARIEALVDNPDIYEPSKRHALLVAHSKHPCGGTPKTLLKDLRNWWQGGQTQDALLGKYEKCGRSGVVGTGGRGRGKLKKPDAANAVDSGTGKRPYQLTQDDIDHMRSVIELYYFDKKVRRSLAATLLHLHGVHYTYQDGNGTTCLRPRDECPSYRQLDYFLKANYPLEARETARKGAKRFAQEDRSTQGSIQLECHGAGHIYEFDATIVDVPLVSSKVRTDIVGKPTLYLIVDRHSRLIVGWYIGFESACYSAAMQAILSIGADKEELCRQLDIPYDPADWPAHGILPEMFLADQGELMHKKARRIARSLRSTLSNVPGLRPDWKPLVECSFSMLHIIIAPDTPAYIADAEAKQRRGVNRDREVALNIHEFTRLIVCAIIAHNKTMQVKYPLSLEQAADGVRPIPTELWSHSIRRRMGVLDQMNFEKVREELMPRDHAVVTADGIRFERMYYTCAEAETRGWLVEGRRKRKPLDIAFDYRSVDEIIVYSPDGSGESYVARLTKDSGKFEGLSLAEVKRHFHSVDGLTANADEVKRQVRFEYRERTKPTNDNAIRKTRAEVNGASRSSRRAATAPARASELQDERSRVAGVRHPLETQAPASPPKPPQAPPTTSPSAKVIPINRLASQDVANPSARESQPGGASSVGGMSLKERMAALRRNMST